MHYELWDVGSGNVIDVFEAEADALARVRWLLATSWDARHLTLGLDCDEEGGGDDALLPPVIGSAELAQRAGATDRSESRRST